MSGSATTAWPQVQVHPGAGLVDRYGDTVLVVPRLPTSHREGVRELLDLCHRPEPTGRARVPALRALLDRRPVGELPGFALLVRTGHTLLVVAHCPVEVSIDGRRAGWPGPGGHERLAEHVLEDGAWRAVAIVDDGAAHPPDVADILSLDLAAGAVPGGGVTLHAAATGRGRQPDADPEAAVGAGGATSATALRPVVQFRAMLLGECARSPAARGRRPPLPVAGAADDGGAGPGTRGPEVVVDAVRCPQEHVTDPDLATCLTCGTPLPPDGHRVRLPRPPLGVLVTDAGMIYTVTGDLVLGREPEQASDVLAGAARPLPLRDAGRSTSRVHARLTVAGWRVLLRDCRSANGTFVSRSGAAGPWLPATPEVPVTLAHGDRLRLGRRQLLFDTWREAVLPPASR